MSRSRTTAAVLLPALLAVPPLGAPQDRAGSGGDPPGLTLLAAGILSTGAGMFAGLEANRPLGRTYRIRLASDRTGPRRVSGIQQLLSLDDDDPRGIHVIEVTNADDPRLQRFIRAMVRERNVSVVVDMDLVAGSGQWDEQTTQLARIATTIGEERKAAYPDSRNSIMVHSAAAVGLSKLIAAGHGALFSEKVASAPQTDNLPRDVLIVQAVGDRVSTPTGSLLDVTVGGPAGNPRGWLDRGNRVIRISGEGFDMPYVDLDKPQIEYMIDAHMAANRHGVADRSVEVLIPVPAAAPGEAARVERFTLQNVSIAQVLKVFENRAGPLHVAPGDSRFAEFDRLKILTAELERLEPPRGGGVALRATAELPFAPGDVLAARWEEVPGRLVLERRGGGTWRLPPMHPQIARDAYHAVFGGRARDPEFSIGAPLVPGTFDAFAAGMQPAYYLGPIENTLLGLVLATADSALGEIAYGGTRTLAWRHLDEIVGYHSLPELFPEKYADPGEGNPFVGTADRVVIQSLPSRLARTPAGELAWARVPELAVRFGRTTPAERGYAALFTAHYFALVERVPELRDLVECSRVVGTFRWLRENRVPVSGLEAPEHDPTPVFTPHQVRERESIGTFGVAPLPPLVRYGEHGPLEIQPRYGGPVLITYQRGHLHTITRPDGRVLTVHSDDLGRPVAVEAEGFGAAALVHGPPGEFTLVDDVVLLTRGGRLVGFRRRDSSRHAPAADAWELVESVASRFIATAWAEKG